MPHTAPHARGVLLDLARWLATHPAVAWSALVGLAMACYAPALGRGFVSVDYVFLGHLARGDLWETFWSQLSGPFLGAANAPMWRPLSTLFVQLELELFGVEPAGYLLVHLGLHLVNVWLLHGVVRRLWGRDDPVAAWTVALLFALHPVHLNTVSFVGSYASLLVATFALLAWRAHLAGRWGVSALAYAFALGSYELAAVLPALLLVHDLLARRRLGRSDWLAGHGVAWLLTASYFALRTALLGQALGGYDDMRGRLLTADLMPMAQECVRGLVLLVVPDHASAPGLPLLALVAAALGAVTLLALARWRDGGDGSRWWLLGVAWVVATQAPYAFARVVPANGRYAYMTVMGLGLLAVAAGTVLARGGLPATASLRRLLPALMLAAVHVPLLGDAAVIYRGAADLAGRMRVEAERVDTPPDAPLFLGGHPAFVSGAGGTPFAQVFAWGLSDAFRPPFTEEDRRVYPLPNLDRQALRPVILAAEGQAAWWIDDDWLPCPRPRGKGPGTVSLRPCTDDPLLFQWRSPARHHRLVVLARVNPLVLDLAPSSTRAGWRDAALPAWLVDLDRRITGDTVYWWMEGRDDAGRVVSQSALQRLDPPGD